MKSFRVDRIEALESRSLLTAAPAGLVQSITAQPQVTRGATAVVLTFTETNSSNHAITVSDGPSIDGFTVTQNARVVWRSNTGIQPLFVASEVLAPGQSLTLKATWDGRSNQPTFGGAGSGPALRGHFTVTNALAANYLAAQVTLKSAK